MKHLVAVYGTLKKGYRNNDYLGRSKLIGYSHTGEGYSLFVDFLPYLFKDDSGKGCQIEIYEVSQSVLESLDSLEGHPVYYMRTPLRYSEDGREIWIYISQNKNKYDLKFATDSYDGKDSVIRE